MKETLYVNIGSEAFTLDKDAFELLEKYFAEIRRRLPEGDTETLADIEARMAELFRERVTSPMRVVTIEVVRSAMAQMGAPSDFGEPRTTDPSPEENAPQESSRRLCRSRTKRSIAGVCGGLADFFDADPTMIRLVMLLLIFCGGLSVWVYIILWIAIPEEPRRSFSLNREKF